MDFADTERYRVLEIIKLSALLLLSSMIGGCSSLGVIGGEIYTPVKWEFIESVGGLALGDPYLGPDDILWIPISVDFSGNRRITTEPTLKNSGLRCLQVAGVSGSANAPAVWNVEFGLYAIEDEDSTRPDLCGAVPVALVGLRSAGLALEAVTLRVYYRESRLNREFLGNVRL